MISWMQKSQELKLGGMANLDLGAVATRDPSFRMDELLKSWGVHHKDFLNEAPEEPHAPEALANKAEVKL
jgi:hypothetical protein